MNNINKSVLVIDTPESCRTCPLHYVEFGDNDIFGTAHCGFKQEYIDYHYNANTKPDWCPLSPLPPYKDLAEYINNATYAINSALAYQYAQGWNNCREEILKGNTNEENN